MFGLLARRSRPVFAARGRDLTSDQPQEESRRVQYGSCRRALSHSKASSARIIAHNLWFCDGADRSATPMKDARSAGQRGSGRLVVTICSADLGSSRLAAGCEAIGSGQGGRRSRRPVLRGPPANPAVFTACS